MSADDPNAVGLVIAAAGSSQRFGARGNKLLCELDGIPLFCHCIRTFVPAAVAPENTVIVTAPDQFAIFAECLAAAGLPSIRLVSGGAMRQQSVLNGVEALPATVRWVAVQDAARPYTSLDLLVRCVDSARRRGSGVAARRVTDTIKIATNAGVVNNTPERSLLWAAETPQVFERHLLEKAYREVLISGKQVTDDAQAVEMTGATVYLVESSSPNPKITFAHDLQAATNG